MLEVFPGIIAMGTFVCGDCPGRLHWIAFPIQPMCRWRGALEGRRVVALHATVTVNVEMRHQFGQFASIGVQQVAGCGGLFNHSGVLLGDLVQLGHAQVDLAQPC